MSYVPQVSRDPYNIRPSTMAIATTYDASPNALRMQNWNQLILLCDMTLNTATSVEIKVQFASPAGDGTPASGDWFDQAYEEAATVASAVAPVPVSTKVYRMTATGKLRIAIPVCDKWVRVVAKTTGGPGSTTLSITAAQGMA